MKKIAFLNILILFLLFGCENKESEKLDLESNLITFDYTSLKGKNVEELIDLIVQKELDYIYTGDQDVVSGISLEYSDSAMIFIYFDKDESIDIFSEVDLALVRQNEIKMIMVFNGRSASDLILQINLTKEPISVIKYPERD
ncbi:MAG: hypothetical protein CVV25_11935 [Ignavibacteriae bacterium HGW-Ignavibacteriae-4]|jgi:hypothetical protein|nr:MAG: hypothetical protein CVV25_11935 [Ignavibacteriae bacterium HGW-Ignavibacteriae-4]